MRSGSVVFVVAFVLTLLATGGLHALGRASPQPLSHTQFVSAADGACYRAAEEFSPLHKNEKYSTLLRSYLPVLERMRSSFSGLKPPQNDAGLFQLMLNNLDRHLRADHDLLRFYASDPLQFGKAAMSQERASVRLRVLSARLGLGWCRWVWTWHPQSPSP